MPLASVEIVGAAPLAGLGIERQLLPYPVQTASAADLRQADNLTDYLARRLAGVNVSEVSGSPFQNDLSFRGFRASPVLGTAQGISVYLDGVRVNEAFGDVVNWDMIPEAALANVLMVPGSNPVYGLNTLGGALALATHSGRSHPGVSVDASVSAAGRRRLDLAAGRRGEDGWPSLAAMATAPTGT
jgi:outer membrane cobalamin receptor